MPNRLEHRAVIRTLIYGTAVAAAMTFTAPSAGAQPGTSVAGRPLSCKAVSRPRLHPPLELVRVPVPVLPSLEDSQHRSEAEEVGEGHPHPADLNLRSFLNRTARSGSLHRGSSTLALGWA